jgi:hypothetical protein
LRRAADWLTVTKLVSRAQRFPPVHRKWFHPDADLRAPPHWRREAIWALHFAKVMKEFRGSWCAGMQIIASIRGSGCIGKDRFGFGSGAPYSTTAIATAPSVVGAEPHDKGYSGTLTDSYYHFLTDAILNLPRSGSLLKLLIVVTQDIVQPHLNSFHTMSLIFAVSSLHTVHHTR